MWNLIGGFYLEGLEEHMKKKTFLMEWFAKHFEDDIAGLQRNSLGTAEL